MIDYTKYRPTIKRPINRSSTELNIGDRRNTTAPNIPQIFPITKVPFLPSRFESMLDVKDPVTPPIKKIETIADHKIFNPSSEISFPYRCRILSLQ